MESEDACFWPRRATSRESSYASRGWATGSDPLCFFEVLWEAVVGQPAGGRIRVGRMPRLLRRGIRESCARGTCSLRVGARDGCIIGKYILQNIQRITQSLKSAVINDIS